jgi:cobyrinic acid a,c-diamide synthase
MATSSSRLVIAGLSGDSGKTIATLSILTALRHRGFSVSAFKKGPDYIDPAWLALASESACRSLDTYMVDPDVVFSTFVAWSERADIAIVEGNRGLFDGKDLEGTHSTAALARLLRAPVILVVDAAKTTRTVAALVKGCMDFDPGLEIAGVILNRVAGERHLRVLSDSIQAFAGVPVLGAIPDLGGPAALIPGRHLGLVPPTEHEFGVDLRWKLRSIAERHLDIERIIEIAQSAGTISSAALDSRKDASARVRIGYFRDAVFTFYYPENLEALEARGGRLVPVSSLQDANLPAVDALYIGGGFPETHAEQLTRNRSMMNSVREAALEGMPVYAECGGLIYLSRSLLCDDKTYPMAGLFPIDLRMHAKPVGHGYTMARVDRPNPFYPVGTFIRGHEFHYSGLSGAIKGVDHCMAVETGVGTGDGRDGLTCANTLACYTHVHACGVDTWASSIVSRAAEYAMRRRRRSTRDSGAVDWRDQKDVENNSKRRASWQRS